MIGALYDDDNGFRSGSAYVFTRDGAGVWGEQAKLLASDGASYDQFGWSVAVDGDTAVIGVTNGDGYASISGTANVFTRDAMGEWTQKQKLTASDGVRSDEFGYSVAVDGDTAVIGARGSDNGLINSGSTYVFTRSGGSWNQQAKLTASDGADSDEFGFSVAVDEDTDTGIVTAVIGAWVDDDNGLSNSGSAYVFTGSGVSWNQQAKLTASDGEGNDRFGSSVAVVGDTAVIGAFLDDDNGLIDSGASYVFTRSGGSWSEQAKLTATDGASYDQFGSSVAVDGETAVIGARLDDDNGFHSGSAYVFTRSAGVWDEKLKLLASDGASDDFFGDINGAVGVSGSTIVAGAPRHDTLVGGDDGAAYFFSVFIGDGDGIADEIDGEYFTDLLEFDGIDIHNIYEIREDGFNISATSGQAVVDPSYCGGAAAFPIDSSGGGLLILTKEGGGTFDLRSFTLLEPFATSVVFIITGIYPDGSAVTQPFLTDEFPEPDLFMVDDQFKGVTSVEFDVSFDLAGAVVCLDDVFVSQYVDQSKVFSGNFTDQNLSGTSFGSITSRGDLIVQAIDLVSPTEMQGMQIEAIGAGTAQVQTCNDPVVVTDLTDGDVVNFKCGSVTTIVERGDGVKLVMGDGDIIVAAPVGAITVITQTAGEDIQIENSPESNASIVVTISGQELQVDPGDLPVEIEVGIITSDIEPSLAAVGNDITLKAKVEHFATGGGIITGAEYSIDGGSFMTMSVADGEFNAVTEDVIGTIPAFTETETGVYEVCVRGVVVDNVGENKCILLAIYDPNGGFVTGGGWFNSPVGAYMGDGRITGKATFGFVAKYKKGQSVPDGNTEFQFKAGDLEFKSTDYDWLVVAGHKGIFMGSGTSNGVGNYGFQLSAIDAALTSSTDDDLFRIKIWDKDADDAVIYDNNLSTDDNADPTTTLGGGAIVIHTDKHKK